MRIGLTISAIASKAVNGTTNAHESTVGNMDVDHLPHIHKRQKE
jgi:hypothetical protein